MSDETVSDEMPEWVQRLVEQIEPRLVYHSVGQIDLRWTDDSELLIAPAVFQIESDDDTNGQSGYGAYVIEDTLALASLLTTESGEPPPVSCGAEPETGVIAVWTEGRFGKQDVWLQIQFEPFEDAEPTFIVDLRGDEDDEPASGNGNGKSG